MAVLLSTARAECVFPRERDPTVSRELNWLAEQSLAHRAVDRPAATVFVSQLRAYLAGQELEVYQYSLSERSSRVVKNHPGKILGVLGGLVLVALVAALLVLLGEQKLMEKEQALEKIRAERKERELIAAKESKKKAQSQAKRAKRVLELLNDARNKQRRGAPFNEILSTVAEALRIGDRSLDQLVEGARILGDAGQKKKAKSLLEEAVERHPPAFQALFFSS
jgi:hypothetical protein